jgi:uncharacterized protein (DUF58 family)
MFKRYVYQNYRVFAALKFRLRRRFTELGWVVVGAMCITAPIGVDTNMSLAYQTFTFLLCLFGISALCLKFNRGDFSVERVLPRLGSAGQKLSYGVVLKNKTRVPQRTLTVFEELPDPRPSFEEFRDTPEPGEEKRNWLDRTYGYYRWRWLLNKNIRATASQTEVPLLPPNGSTDISLDVLPMKRGSLRLAAIAVSTPEPFGLFRATKRIAVPQSILILPKRYPIPRVPLPGSSKYQQGGVALASSIGESEEFVSLRDYRAGDPLRHIHWKSFAKIGKPIVKEFQDEFFVRHALILDTFGVPMHNERFEEAVSVAASFVCTIDSQDSLLDLMFIGPQAFCFTAGRGVAHTERMLEILATVQPCADKEFSSLELLVLEHLNNVSGCICILLDWDAERKNFVKKLRTLGVPLLVFVLSDTDVRLDAGPMADQPENLRILPLGNVAKALATL